jgi:hypothetical protein
MNTVKKAKGSKATESMVKITEWYPQLSSGAETQSAMVRLEDGRMGMLRINLDNSFTRTGNPCRLAVLRDDEKGGCHIEYLTSPIILPEDLRKHILKARISAMMSNIADRLAENRDEIPEFSAYVSAEGMKDGRCEAEELTQLADCLESFNFDEDVEDDEAAIPNLRALALEMQKD